MPSGYPVKADLVKNIDAPSQIVFFYDSLDEWSQFMLYMLQSIISHEERLVCVISPAEEDHLRTFIEYKRQDPLWNVSMDQIAILSTSRVDKISFIAPLELEGILINEIRNSISMGYKKFFLLVSLDALDLEKDREDSIIAFVSSVNSYLNTFPCVSLCALNSGKYSTSFLQKVILLHGKFIKNLRLYQNPHYLDSRVDRNIDWLDNMVEKIENQNLQNLWSEVITHTFHPLALYTEDGRLLNCNAAYCSLFDYTEERLRGISLQEVLSLAGCTASPSLLSGDEIHVCIDKYGAPDGRELALELLLRGVFDSSGGRYYALSIADISEKQGLANKLKMMEEELQALLESINDTVFIMDKEQKYKGIYGRGIFEEDLIPGLFLGKTPAQVFVKEKADLFTQASQKALSGEKVTYEYTLGNNGSAQSFQAALAPIRDRKQQITGLVGISRNISELKNAQIALQTNYEEIEAMNQDLEFYQNRLLKKNEELHDSQKRLELALWGAREAFWDWDLEAGRLQVDDRWVDVLKDKQDKVFSSQEWISLIHPDDKQLFREKSIACIKGETPHFEEEYRVHSGQEWIWILVKGSVVGRDSKGRALRVIGTYQNINGSKQADTAFEEIEQRYQRLFEQSPIGLVRFDASGVINDANTRFLDLMGSNNKEVLKNFNLFYSKEAMEAGLEERVKETLINKAASQGELLFQIPGGKKIWLRYNIDPVLNSDGSLKEVMMACEDYTEKKTNEMKIMYLSFHDRLTGLYNRAFFEEELKRIDVERQLPLSIAMGDINGLKLVNDAFGHQEGDRLLRKISDILRQSCREEDIIARWGGDEFIILLPQTDTKTAANICERIKRNSTSAEASPITLSMALGFATKDSMSQNINETIKKAENDMYLNKLMESKNTRSSIISSLENTLWERTVETREHTERMQRIALRMAAGMGMRKHDADKLMLLAKLHDIGKIGIPNDMLRKPGGLLPEEWDTVKKHSEIGYRIVNASPELAVISEEILSHHERWNGQGYPRGLKGDEIPQLARVISIIDAYDVMTHNTPYKAPISHEQALNELQRNAGVQFDPKLVEVFVYNFT